MTLCKKCGATHGMGFENMETGEINPLEYCKECLFGNGRILFSPHINIEDISSEAFDIMRQNIMESQLKLIREMNQKVQDELAKDA